MPATSAGMTIQLRLDREHGAADHATGAQIIECGLRLVKRPRMRRYRRDFSGACQLDEFARLRQRACQRALDSDGFDRDHGGWNGKTAAKESADDDLAATREHSGRKLQRFVRADKITNGN